MHRFRAFVFRTVLVTLALSACACGGPSRTPTAGAPSAVSTIDPGELDALKSADDARASRAAVALARQLSPWQRSLEDARRRQLGGIVVSRPMTRPTTHPDARAVESAAIDADAGLARGSNRDVRKNVLVLLAEVAGEPGVTHLRAELARTEDPEAAVDVMRALETVYGLPAFYEPHALQCGEPGPPDVTRAIMDQHRTGEARRFVEGRRALLAWLDANAGVPRERRVREAFRAWDERHWIAQPNTSPEGIGFTTVLRYATIVRLGDDALPELRARRDAAAANDDLAEAGRFETLRAAIHGEVDRALVRRLLDDESDHRAVMYGVEAIGAAADQRWVPELDALQLSTMDEVANLSSHTLALILGAEAVPMLRAAAAKNRDNYTAGAFADTLTGR